MADPNTGLAVYDTYGAGGWLVVGGTSASSPIIASVYALAGAPGRRHLPGVVPVRAHRQAERRHERQQRLVQPTYLCTAARRL